MDLKDIGLRAVKTAIQAFIGVVGVSLVTDVAVYKAGAIAAASAAVSVIMNAILSWSQK